MKRLAYIALATVCCSYAIASDGHNGIRFDMTQKQVEAKGFVCNSTAEVTSSVIAQCRHMDMTGVAFGFPTKDYRVSIGRTKRVDMIGADFSARIGTADYFSLHEKIAHFFPTKNAAGTLTGQDIAVRTEWRAKNNAAAVLLLIKGAPPIIKDSLSITFWSPRAIADTDKENK